MFVFAVAVAKFIYLAITNEKIARTGVLAELKVLRFFFSVCNVLQKLEDEK